MGEVRPRCAARIPRYELRYLTEEDNEPFCIPCDPRNDGQIIKRSPTRRQRSSGQIRSTFRVGGCALFCRQRGFDAQSPYALRRVHLPFPDPTWPPSVPFPRVRTSAAQAFAVPAQSASARFPPLPAPSTNPVSTCPTDPPRTSTSGAARSPSPSPRARPRCVKRLIRSDTPIGVRLYPRIASPRTRHGGPQRRSRESEYLTR